jgi:hypothetical protein
MLRAVLVLVLGAAVPVVAQQSQSVLNGTLESGIYTAASNAFKIQVPVLPELGARISDTEHVVMFQDSFDVQISIGAFRQDATQRWELSTRGMKDYLIYFMGNIVLEDFRRYTPGTTIESAKYAPDYMEGALFCYILLPGGSMFANQVAAFTDPNKPPVAKRGNLLFVKNGVVFVVSTELAERVTEGAAYKKTPEEEDQILRKRLVDIVSKMQFPKPPATPTPAPAK